MVSNPLGGYQKVVKYFMTTAIGERVRNVNRTFFPELSNFETLIIGIDIDSLQALTETLENDAALYAFINQNKNNYIIKGDFLNALAPKFEVDNSFNKCLLNIV